MDHSGWDNARRFLEDNGFRLTPQRKFLLQIFIEQPGCHFSAEEIYQALLTQKPPLGMATVYRSLELFKRLVSSGKSKHRKVSAVMNITTDNITVILFV